MSTLSLLAPAPLIGENLKAEIIAAGFDCQSVVFVSLAVARPGQTTDLVEIQTSATAAQIQPVVTAHTGQPTAAQQIPGTLSSRAAAALTTNATFLALASPSNAQTVAQVQALTKECNALIRLLLGRLDSTTGT